MLSYDQLSLRPPTTASINIYLVQCCPCDTLLNMIEAVYNLCNMRKKYSVESYPKLLCTVYCIKVKQMMCFLVHYRRNLGQSMILQDDPRKSGTFGNYMYVAR